MNKLKSHILVFFAGIFILALPLSACDMLGTTSGTTLAETVFEVTLPQPLGENEILYFEMVEEVTGIALNPTRYEMEAKDDYSYYVRIPLLIGSVVKYRYVREGSGANIIERDSHGSVVQYRVSLINKAAVVSDAVTGWDETEFTGASGAISGYIYNKDTEEPLSEILVYINGQQTSSTVDGFYEVRDLPVGEYDLVAMHPNGKYEIFQQGAVIAENSITPASFGIKEANMVAITFVMTPPENEITTGEVRFISNLYNLGNTYSEQEGGVSVLPSIAPIMEPQNNGTYSLTLELPEDFDLQYKYSLGDGFINAEHDESGSYKVRQYIVPGKKSKVSNTVYSWFSSGSEAIKFNIAVPENTPENDIVTIQFNPFVWMEPLPMQNISDNNWTFTLYSPQEYLDNAQFRFCRNYQCSLADDAVTIGSNAAGYVLDLSSGSMSTINYNLEKWAGLDYQEYTFTPESIPADNNVYIKGIELDKDLNRKDASTSDWGIVNAAVYGANMLILTPTWTTPVSTANKMNIETGDDLLFSELEELTAASFDLGLSTALYPQPRFTTTKAEYWKHSDLTYNWWHDWFDKYERFILSYAAYAETSGIQTLIIGGSQVSPAFPIGSLPDGNTANTPYDFTDRWSGLIESVREKFSGQLFFALPYSKGFGESMDMLTQVDAIYIEMDSAIVGSNSASFNDIQSSFASLLNSEIYNLYAIYQKPVILGIDYPSIEGSASNCLNFSNSCEAFIESQDNAFVSLDLSQQARIYQAIIEESIQYDWIYGLVSKGYNPSVSVLDNSSSVQSKPASSVIAHYFNSLIK